jgi:hypothetical protein
VLLLLCMSPPPLLSPTRTCSRPVSKAGKCDSLRRPIWRSLRWMSCECTVLIALNYLRSTVWCISKSFMTITTTRILFQGQDNNRTTTKHHNNAHKTVRTTISADEAKYCADNWWSWVHLLTLLA